MKRSKIILAVLILSTIALIFSSCGGGGTTPPINHSPTITSTPITTATVDVLYTYDVDATDPDGDTLTYSLTTPTGMTINSTTGVINWTPTSAQIGDNAVTVEVSDGKLSDTQSFTVIVSESNHAPVITSAPVTSATKDEAYSYDVNATDSDGDTLVYSLTTKPSGMSINSSTGLITWTPTTSGNYNVTVKASDGELFDTQSFTVIVEETGTYSLRDIGPAGGWIFYDKGSFSDGWRYLEALPFDNPTHPPPVWSSRGTLIGGTKWGIGTGQSNTTKIVTWLNSHSETNRAAQWCDALVYGGYDDWFLPSLGELFWMYKNLWRYGVGNFTCCKYWSSTEWSADYAWYQEFLFGYQKPSYKTSEMFIRAARAF